MTRGDIDVLRYWLDSKYADNYVNALLSRIDNPSADDRVKAWAEFHRDASEELSKALHALERYVCRPSPTIGVCIYCGGVGHEPQDCATPCDYDEHCGFNGVVIDHVSISTIIPTLLRHTRLSHEEAERLVAYVRQRERRDSDVVNVEVPDGK